MMSAVEVSFSSSGTSYSIHGSKESFKDWVLFMELVSSA